MKRLLVLAATAALASGCCTAALGQMETPVATWQQAADTARIPLLAPTPPEGFAPPSITVQSPACEGQADALITSRWVRTDGAAIVLRQYDGACTPDYSSEIGTIPLRGGQGMVVAREAGCLYIALGAVVCASLVEGAVPPGRAIVYDSGGVEVSISSNLNGYEPLYPLLEAAPVVAPAPGLGPLYERLEAKVLRVTAPDQLVVRADGQVRGVRLAGISAPRAAQCWAPQALRYAKRLFPAGRSLWLEDDPGAGKRYWAFRNFGDGPVAERAPLNSRVVEVGAAKAAPGSWRFSVTEEQRLARQARNGLWGTACRGSLRVSKKAPQAPAPRPVGLVSPAPPPAPSTPTPAPSSPAPPAPVPTTPAPSTPGNIYNCSDFPLADGTTAQQYLARYPSDPSRLDADHDGVACESS